MAIGTQGLAPIDLDGMDDETLVAKLKEAKEELFNLRFQSATGQLDNHGRLRAVRKDIARIYTEMRERELGIGLPPAKRAAADQATEVKDAKPDKKAKKADKAEQAEKKSKKKKKAEDES